MKPFQAFCLALLLVAGCATLQQTAPPAGGWDLGKLKEAPVAEWGARTGLVQEVYYQGEPFHGRPTRVFAYLGRPATGKGPYPAMLLVHGGGGKAFRDWAEHWAKRGYVALAMDTAGCGPNGRLADGGPDQTDETKFRDFADQDRFDMWSYHAVAAVLRGHSLLARLPDVDRSRIGITGISWGGYLTCMVAGLDDRLKVAVPVYGCGFLGDDSAWKATSLARMSPDARGRWLRDFDPSQYLADVKCPILFLNGTRDFAYPLNSYRASYQRVPARFRQVIVIPDLPHGHIWTFAEVDQFVDSKLRGGKPLPRLDTPTIRGDDVTATAKSSAPIKQASLLYTTDTGAWQKRQWETVPAQIKGDTILATLPEQRPLTWYLLVTDEHGLRASTEHEEWPGEKPGR